MEVDCENCAGRCVGPASNGATGFRIPTKHAGFPAMAATSWPPACAVDRTLAFGALQAVLVPLVRAHPPLAVAVGGHVLAVVVAAVAAVKQGG